MTRPALESVHEERVVEGFAATVMPAETAVKRDSGGFLSLVSHYRILLRPGVEIIEGRLNDDVDPTDPEVRSRLTAGGRVAHLIGGDEGVDILLVRTEPARRLWLHALLLAGTLLTVLAAGALLVGVDPLGTRLLSVVRIGVPIPTELDLGQLARGWTFALPLLLILGVHEGGHLIAARRHGVPSTLPYFIPVPPWFSIIGTLGAFIRLRGPIVRRDALLDVGAWGPLAGFVVALPLFIWGLSLSQLGYGPIDPVTPYVIRFGGQPIWLGSSAITGWLVSAFGPGGGGGGGPLILHPLAFAGWLGLFITALNLIPVGQLDGGHIVHALHPRAQEHLARAVLLGLGVLGFFWWGWWFWGLAVLVVSGGRPAHPPLFHERVPLSSGRRWIGWVTILVFFLTIVPVPMGL